MFSWTGFVSCPQLEATDLGNQPATSLVSDFSSLPYIRETRCTQPRYSEKAWSGFPEVEGLWRERCPLSSLKVEILECQRRRVVPKDT